MSILLPHVLSSICFSAGFDTSEQGPLSASTLNSHTPCQLTLCSRRLLRLSECYPASPFTQLGSAQLRQPSSPTAPGCITPAPAHLLPLLQGHQFRSDVLGFSDKRSRCTTQSSQRLDQFKRQAQTSAGSARHPVTFATLFCLSTNGTYVCVLFKRHPIPPLSFSLLRHPHLIYQGASFVTSPKFFASAVAISSSNPPGHILEHLLDSLSACVTESAAMKLAQSVQPRVLHTVGD